MNKLACYIKKNKKMILFYLEFIGLCILAGLGAGCFSVATDKVSLAFIKYFHLYSYSVLIFTPLVFMLIIFLFKRFFPYAGGSGLPQGYALDTYEKSSLYATYSIRTMFGKIVLTLLSIGSGATLGREGPTVQICASIFGSMRNLSLHHKKLLIRVGSGIGIVIAFNAPLGGIIFALEEYLRISNVRVNTLLLLGVAVAGCMGIMIYGDYAYMGTISARRLCYHEKTMLLALITGILCGLLGALYTKMIVYVSVDKGQWIHRFRKKYHILLAGICGFLLAGLGILTDGFAFNNGAFEVRDFLVQGANLPWHYAISKGLGSIFSVAAGVPGGYFSTALSIGAGLMSSVHQMFPVLPVEQFYLLGMAGFLAAITNAPLTAIAMIISIVVGSQHFVLPIIISSFLAAHIASLFGDSVYHQQVLMYIDRVKYHETR